MKTYYVMIAGNYVDQITTDGYGTTAYEQDALVLYYNEAVQIAYELNIRNGRTDYAIMEEAYEDEQDEDAYNAEYDEHQRKANALAERADDSRDDR